MDRSHLGVVVSPSWRQRRGDGGDFQNKSCGWERQSLTFVSLKGEGTDVSLATISLLPAELLLSLRSAGYLQFIYDLARFNQLGFFFFFFFVQTVILSLRS